MWKCSYCGKENDDGFTNCGECGTPLTGDSADVQSSQVHTVTDPRRAQGEKLKLYGVLWFIGGMAITLYSYAAAVGNPRGGHYLIAYGAIIFGIALFFRGRAAAAGTDTNTQAEELLDLAAAREGADRAKALELYEEVVRRFPGTRASNEAQRNIQTLTARKE
jgi:hypothetical protein